MTYLTRARSLRPVFVKRGVGDIFDDLDTILRGGALPADQADPADAVNQTTTGTSTSSADFVQVGGVCRAQNFPALSAVRGLQGQLNRVAQVKGYQKIADDGAIGPATLALFRQVQAAAGTSAVGGDASSCVNIGADSDVLGAQVQSYADSLGAPAMVSGALSLSVPSITTKSGKTVVAPDAGIAGSLATLSSVEQIALLGVAGGIGYLLLSKTKKRRRK